MEILIKTLSVLVGLTLLNVWLLRSRKSTGYRGGDARSLKEEFAVYGLPEWLFYLVGFLKIIIGIALVISVWFPIVVQPTAAILAFLMLSALAMHLRVKDPIKKALPSITLFMVSLFLAIFG